MDPENEATPAETAAPRSISRDIARLRFRLVGTLCVSMLVAVVSGWLFYDLYWKWRVELARGEFADPAGRTLYEEFALWGVVCLAGMALSLVAALALRRIGRHPTGSR